jgi:hypothetical protein
MPFRDILKKKDKLTEGGGRAPSPPPREFADDPPVFTFLRTDTHTQEIIVPPSFSSAESDKKGPFSRDRHDEPHPSHGRLYTGHSRSPSASSQSSEKSRSKDRRRLSERLHLRRADPTSPNVPDDLPEIAPAAGGEGEEEEGEEGAPARESLWEKRATILAKKNGQERTGPVTPVAGTMADVEAFVNLSRSGSPRPSPGAADVNIQEAIRLHEAGDLVSSTKIFGRLADPNGENDPLSQVLYGLALRYVNWPPSRCRETEHRSLSDVTGAVGVWVRASLRETVSDTSP